jgi:hypothetical protein
MFIPPRLVRIRYDSLNRAAARAHRISMGQGPVGIQPAVWSKTPGFPTIVVGWHDDTEWHHHARICMHRQRQEVAIKGAPLPHAMTLVRGPWESQAEFVWDANGCPGRQGRCPVIAHQACSRFNRPFSDADEQPLASGNGGFAGQIVQSGGTAAINVGLSRCCSASRLKKMPVASSPTLPQKVPCVQVR